MASMSTRAFTAETRPQGSLVWTEDERTMYVLVEVLSQHNTLLKVRRKDTREVLEIDLVSNGGGRDRRPLEQLIPRVCTGVRSEAVVVRSAGKVACFTILFWQRRMREDERPEVNFARRRFQRGNELATSRRGRQ